MGSSTKSVVAVVNMSFKDALPTYSPPTRAVCLNNARRQCRDFGVMEMCMSKRFFLRLERAASWWSVRLRPSTLTHRLNALLKGIKDVQTGMVQ